MNAATAINQLIDKAPPIRILHGDKSNPESAEHIIEFPGGAIEIARCTDGTYWAHIIINRGEAIEDCKGFNASQGKIIGSRIVRKGDNGVTSIDNAESIQQIAVLIQTV